MKLFLKPFHFLFILSFPSALFSQSLISSKIEQAHEMLWTKFVDADGLILDFQGELPTPEDCAKGIPNALGWWTPIENGPMFTGLYLPAQCERAARTKNKLDQDQARKMANGLLKSASVSEVKGMVVRGFGTDGTCHYPLGSDDQTHPWFYGLFIYYFSGIPSVSEKDNIKAKIKEVAEANEKLGWKAPCDGSFTGQFRGAFGGPTFRSAARYLFMLKVAYMITQEEIWEERYQKALNSKPYQSELTIKQILALGFSADLKIVGERTWPYWTYVGAQASLAELIKLEKDPTLKTTMQESLLNNAQLASQSITDCKNFDNANTEYFGDADWRKVNIVWTEQKTTKEAESVAKLNPDKKLAGTRKYYEAKYMDTPLAAAAIVAFAGESKYQALIESAISHYDYSKMYLSRFFFAELAYYSQSRKNLP